MKSAYGPCAGVDPFVVGENVGVPAEYCDGYPLVVAEEDDPGSVVSDGWIANGAGGLKPLLEAGQEALTNTGGDCCVGYALLT